MIMYHIRKKGRSCMERNDKCFCGSGKKYKKCHYRINGESKLANIYRAYYEYDMVCREKGICNNCINGCSRCCKDFFFISECEFLLILEELIHRGANIDTYINAAKNIMKNINENHPEIIDRMNEYMPTTNKEIDPSFFIENFDSFDLPKCMFLNSENKCSIYSVRPIICRGYGTTETCRVMSNPKQEFPEKTKLHVEANIISSSNEMDKKIFKRPYPLFYWFAYFLDEEHYDLTMQKVKNIARMTSDEYYRLSFAIL